MARRAYRQDVGMVLKKTRLGGFFVARAKVKWRRAAQFTLAQGRATLARAFMWGTIARSGAHILQAT